FAPKNNELIPVGALSGVTADNGGTGAPAARAASTSSSAIAVHGSLKTRQKEVGFQILAGAAQKLQPSLDAGAVGAVLAFANPARPLCPVLRGAGNRLPGPEQLWKKD